MKNLKKGFTLIELLIVVAVIGILSALIMISTTSSRNKGADAAVKSNLSTVQKQAELLYPSWNTYAVDASPTYFALAQCANTADTLFSNATLWNAIVAAYGNGAGVANTRCISQANSWAVAVQLKTGGTAGDSTPDSWCVDNTGASRAYAWTTGQTIANSINVNVCR